MKGLFRLMDPKSSIDAVDEPIINAFVHSDWNISESLFRMFNGRLGILSYGGMSYSQTKERFL